MFLSLLSPLSKNKLKKIFLKDRAVLYTFSTFISVDSFSVTGFLHARDFRDVSPHRCMEPPRICAAGVEPGHNSTPIYLAFSC